MFDHYYDYHSCNGLHTQFSFHFSLSEFAQQVSSLSSVGFMECNSQTAQRGEFIIFVLVSISKGNSHIMYLL